MKSAYPLWLILLLTSLFIVQCTTPPPTQPTNEPTSQPTTPQTNQPTDPNAPPGYANWQAVLAEANGQTVNWYMWGGQDNINQWVTGYVATELKNRYNITLNMVPISDAAEIVNKVLAEKEAGRTSDGSVDLIWINGENFRTMRQAELLYGPFADTLPNTVFVNWDDPSVNSDFGYPVDYYESPYGKAQFVMIYDSAKLPEPPTSIEELIAWIKANPGKFTYPAPPDFTGTAFMMQMCYHAAGGYEQFLQPFDETLFNDTWGACWDLLNDIEPYLWREGQTYPETHAQHDDLFANGEVWLNMAYNPAEASSKVETGRFPESTRTFLFDSGTLANTHFVAIPFNAPNKAGAMVLADFLLSPEAQLSKADTANWGDRPAIDVNRTSPEWQAAFAELPRGVATLSDAELAQKRLPELEAGWRIAAERAWEANVLQR
jgi:putative spermidine/putrescine transport system substrate-binding protein